MLFLKATYLEYTLFPLPPSHIPAISTLTKKHYQTLCFHQKTPQKNLWNPKLHFRGVFCFEQKCCWGSSLLHQPVPVTCKPYKKFLPKLNIRKTVSPEQLLSSFFMDSENHVTCQVFSFYFGQQKGQIQVWIITNNCAGPYPYIALLWGSPALNWFFSLFRCVFNILLPNRFIPEATLSPSYSKAGHN